jgi:hypothetical protein
MFARWVRPSPAAADTYRYTQSGSASPALRSIEAKSKGFSTIRDIVSDSERKCVLVGSLVG